MDTRQTTAPPLLRRIVETPSRDALFLWPIAALTLVYQAWNRSAKVRAAT